MREVEGSERESTTATVAAGCVKLKARDIAVTVDPSHGAKVTSLVHRSTSREWLLQPQLALVRAPSYGDVFTRAPLCGWDEMFPTVEPCLVNGVELPDHGEVWARPWRVTKLSESRVSCEIRGVAVPYILSRTITVSGHAMYARYSVVTTHRGGLEALWAPHPQFRVGLSTIIVLPRTVSTLARRSDPEARSDQIKVATHGHVAWGEVAPRGSGAMCYVDPSERIGAIELRDATGDSLTMSWTMAAAPYFALWVDNLRYSHEPVVCPEPMTGAFDDLSVAQRNGRVMRIRQGQLAAWSVKVELGRRVRDVRG